MDFIYEIPKPFSFEATVKTHGWFQLTPFYWDNQAKILRWAVGLDSTNPVLISVSEDNDHNQTSTKLLFTGSFPDDGIKDIIIRKFRHIFNLNMDLTGFYKICSRYPILQKVPQLGMGRIMRCESVFEDVFKSICGTNVQWKQAVTMINNIARLGTPVPGSDLRLFPSPEQILDAGEQFLKETGRVGYRSGYLIDLCQRSLQHDQMLTQIENGSLSYNELNKYFLSFKGIGKITARYLCALYGKYDELAVDSLVISYMTKTHFKGIKPTAKKVEDFYSEFGSWKYLAYWMEFIINKGWNPDAG
ncbi:hypothetical protein JXQ31_16535 [candidate division KSB1 bacterium]|nr:hypothetical protein [candidate division KSB1 bacterium]